MKHVKSDAKVGKENTTTTTILQRRASHEAALVRALALVQRKQVPGEQPYEDLELRYLPVLFRSDCQAASYGCMYTQRGFRVSPGVTLVSSPRNTASPHRFKISQLRSSSDRFRSPNTMSLGASLAQKRPGAK